MITTLYIRKDILERVESAAQKRGMARSEIVIALMKKTMNDVAYANRVGKMVRYQESGKKDEWRRFHLFLKADEYEYLLDLRKLLKMSVSLILAVAVRKYLDKLIERNIIDNYLYKDYVILKDIVEGITCWKLLWGFPRSQTL